MDEEVYDNDGNERNEAREASAGDRRAIADPDQAGQVDISGESKTASSIRTPEPPTDVSRMAHNATHVPFRDWCPICVSSRQRAKLYANEKREQTLLRLCRKQVIRAIGLSNQCTDTYKDSHDATEHQLRRSFAYNFQQFHLLFHLQVVILDLFSQDSQCDPTAEPFFQYLFGTTYVFSACLVNRYLF